MNNVIVAQFLQDHPEECAREIENFSLDDILFFLNKISIKDKTHILAYLTPTLSAACMQNFDINISKAIVKQLPLRALQNIMLRINPQLRHELIDVLSRNEKIALQHALSFSMQTVGAFMSTQILFLPSTHSVKQAIDLIRRFVHETTPWLFCVSKDGELEGMIALKDLIIAPHSSVVSHIMQSCPLVLPANAAIQSIVTHAIWEKYGVLPVVDDHNILLGALEYEKIISSIQNLLFNQRKESLFDSLAHIMQMYSHTTENMLNEFNEIVSKRNK